MDNKTLSHIDKVVYIVLVLLATAAAIVAMVAGPLGRDTLSISMSVSAILIVGVLLLHTIRVMQNHHRRR